MHFLFDKNLNRFDSLIFMTMGALIVTDHFWWALVVIIIGCFISSFGSMLVTDLFYDL